MKSYNGLQLGKLNEALLTNIRLGWKWRSATNTLAYNISELITSAKKFYNTDPLGTFS